MCHALHALLITDDAWHAWANLLIEAYMAIALRHNWPCCHHDDSFGACAGEALAQQRRLASLFPPTCSKRKHLNICPVTRASRAAYTIWAGLNVSCCQSDMVTCGYQAISGTGVRYARRLLDPSIAPFFAEIAISCHASIRGGAPTTLACSKSALTALVKSQRAGTNSSSIPCGASGACSRLF